MRRSSGVAGRRGVSSTARGSAGSSGHAPTTPTEALKIKAREDEAAPGTHEEESFLSDVMPSINVHFGR